MRISAWLYLIEQAFCSLCLLLAIGLSAQLPRRAPLRLVLTALFTAAVSFLAAYQPLPWLRPLLILPVTATAPLLAWPGIPRRLRCRMAGLSLLLILLLTGLLRLLSPFMLPSVICMLAVFIGMACVPRIAPCRVPLPQCITIEIRHGTCKLTLTALVDSGNLLRDVITDLPVVLISRRAAEKLLPLPPEGEISPGMRLMPIRTVSGTSMMTIFRPDGLRILTGRVWYPVHALIGLSPDGYEGFQALVPATLLSISPFARAEITLSCKEADLS